MDTTSRKRLMEELAQRHPVAFALELFLVCLGIEGLTSYFHVPWIANAAGLETRDLFVGAVVAVTLTFASRQAPAKRSRESQPG